MITSAFENLRSILCLGAHADDIEIGCGGTILQLLCRYPALNVCWVVFSASPERAVEASNSARDFLQNAGEKRVILKNFRDTLFPWDGEKIKTFFQELRSEFSPDLIFTHRLEDRHQDHRTLAEFTWNTFRDHLIWEYEIPKYEGDLGHPNVYVPLTEAVCQKKITLIRQHFLSQSVKPWFSEDTFRALLRLRGVEIHAESRFAEGFYCRKMVF